MCSLVEPIWQLLEIKPATTGYQLCLMTGAHMNVSAGTLASSPQLCVLLLDFLSVSLVLAEIGCKQMMCLVCSVHDAQTVLSSALWRDRVLDARDELLPRSRVCVCDVSTTVHLHVRSKLHKHDLSVCVCVCVCVCVSARTSLALPNFIRELIV